MALSITSIEPNYGPTAGGTTITITGTDFYSNRVAMLLHCDGDDGSTTFTDDSGFDNAPTAQGNAHIETDDKKFGTASAYFDGNGDYLQLTNPSTALGVFSGDFTLELWLKWKTKPPGTSGGNERQIMGQHNWPESASSGTWWWLVAVSTGLGFNARNNGTYDGGPFASLTWSVDVWYHIAVSRKGSECYLYINGSRVATDTSFTRSIFADDSRAFSIGADADGNAVMCHAYMDDIRITKGLALYTDASFDVPNAEMKAQVARVTIDGNACLSATVQSDTEITAKTPPGTVGSKDVALNI